MGVLELESRHQKAVYWAASGYDDYGEPTLDAPVDLDVQWENVDAETIDSHGNTIAIDAIVVVDREIPVGSVLWEGELSDLPGTSETPTADLRGVVKYSAIPDIKGRYFRRLVYLRRLSDELPDLT